MIIQARGITCGLMYLHDNDIVHGDLTVVSIEVFSLDQRTGSSDDFLGRQISYWTRTPRTGLSFPRLATLASHES